jgi:hypothetical protein
VNSDDTDYIMQRIREKYLTGTSVSLVLVGKCTWARRFVDWEIYATLRNDKNNKRSGLLAIQLPSVAQSGAPLPERLKDNVKGKDGNEGYARYWVYPKSASSLKRMVQEAYDARTSKSQLIDNSRARRLRNSACS